MCKFNKFIKVLLSLFLLVSLSVNAQVLDVKNLPDLTLDKFDGSSRVQRVDAAKKILNGMNELKLIIPELSDISKENLERQREYIYQSKKI